MLYSEDEEAFDLVMCAINGYIMNSGPSFTPEGRNQTDRDIIKTVKIAHWCGWKTVDEAYTEYMIENEIEEFWEGGETT
jgi:hypothetical protein